MVLSSIIQRGLVRSARLVRLRIELRDVPGALAEITKCIGEVDANIVEVRHQRTFTTTPLQSAEVEFVLQTRGHDHVEQIVTTLAQTGYRVFSPDGNVSSIPG